MVVEYFLFDQRVDFYFSGSDIFPLYLGVITISVVYGTLGTLLVEVPFAKL